MNLADLLWQTLTNPNVVYLLLIAGLWSVAIAITTPGTGFAEAGAVVLLGLALFGLARLPVNVLGLGLIILSFFLYVLELKASTHGAFLIAGILTLAGGSLFLFRSDEANAAVMRVSLGLIIVTVLGTAGFAAFALRKALELRRRPLAQNPDAVIGAFGEAKTDIHKEGTVQVGSELWSAEADELILAGAKVQIVRRSGLRLKVIRASASPPA